MASAREIQDGRRWGPALSAARREGDTPTSKMRTGGGGARQVLEPDRSPRTLVIIVHKEGVNQFPWMAYYGGVFSGKEVGVRALDFIPKHPYPVRAMSCTNTSCKDDIVLNR
jgi:hypothetical protein